jgi:uncharacterized protein YdhG (YjbR/CyaY superfamily)
MARSSATSINEYIAEFPDEVRERLEAVRAIVREEAPDAVETISYAIPTFDLDGTHLVHFAGYARHVGFYPTGSGIDEFADELKPYKHARGSVQFPLSRPLPDDLIRRMVAARVRQVRGAAQG